MFCMARKSLALTSLATAAALWGLSVPLSKLALVWLSPTWLATMRFALAAPLLAVSARRSIREALKPAILGGGAIGFGAVIMLQNVGVEHTSVSHAAVLVGAVPVFVAVATAMRGRQRRGLMSWCGVAVAVLGVLLVAGTGGHGSSPSGDAMVLLSSALSAGFIVAQPRLLAGRDPAAVTAVQLAAGSLVSLPIALLTGGLPHAPAAGTSLGAVVALAVVGTLLPFWLFALGQAHVSADVAGPYLNLEPVVGAALGWIAFGDAAGLGQIAGVAAVLGGIILSTLPHSGEDIVPMGTYRRLLALKERVCAAPHGHWRACEDRP